MVFDAMEEFGRAAPDVSWPRELDPLAEPAAAGISARFLELTARGRVAYEKAVLELAGDVPRRERAYATQYRVVVRDLRAILPCALRRRAPFFVIVNAGMALELALGTQFRLLDESTVVALEKDATALCGMDATWRGPLLRSFARGRATSAWISDRRLAIASFEREMAATPGRPTRESARIWHELVVFAMNACDLANDRDAGNSLYEHASRHRGALPTSPILEDRWKHVQNVLRTLTTRPR